MVAEIECAAPLNAWPIIAVVFTVGALVGAILGSAFAFRRAERMVRGGARRVEL